MHCGMWESPFKAFRRVPLLIQKMGERAVISSYRKFIFSLSEALSKRDLTSLKYLLCDELTVREIENINDPMDLLCTLERRCILGNDNFDLLKDLCKQIHRQDLVKKIKDFQRGKTTERGFVSSNETQPTDQRTQSCPLKAEDLLDCKRRARSDSKFQGSSWWDTLRDIFPSRCNRNFHNDNEEDDCELGPPTLASQEQLNEDDITLTDFESYDPEGFDQMCLMLDCGRRAFYWDYQRLAARYKMIPEAVLSYLQIAHRRNESPSKMVMDCLERSYPNLPLRHFVWTLKEIGRKDIAEKLKPYVKTREEWYRSNSKVSLVQI